MTTATATLTKMTAEEAVASVEKLISWWLKRLDWRGEFEDGQQAGRLGALQAHAKFDPERGVKFSTFASWSIRQAIEAEMKKSPLAVEELPEVAGDTDEVVNAAAAAELREALKGLTAAEAELLRWRFQDEETFEVIGERLRVIA